MSMYGVGEFMYLCRWACMFVRCIYTCLHACVVPPCVHSSHPDLLSLVAVPKYKHIWTQMYGCTDTDVLLCVFFWDRHVWGELSRLFFPE